MNLDSITLQCLPLKTKNYIDISSSYSSDTRAVAVQYCVLPAFKEDYT